jgi:hypothetical protein
VTKLEIRWADVAMEDAEFSRRAIVTGAEQFQQADGLPDDRDSPLSASAPDVKDPRPDFLPSGMQMLEACF